MLIRAARHRGQPIKRFAHQLAGTMSSQWPLFLSSHLAVLAKAMSLTSLGLLYDHTVFPYSTARMGPFETKRLARNIIELRGKSLTVLVQSASVGRGIPRYCQACIDDDLSHYGESYWRRRHNLPFIQRCSIHGELLLALPVKKHSAAIAVTRLPEECDGLVVKELLPDPTASVLMDLSIGCLEAMDRREELEWRQEYRQLAERKGYPRQGCGFSSLSVLTAFRQFYGEELLDSAGLNFLPTETNAWPIMLLRSGYEVAATTARHLLVQTFLEHSDVPIPMQITAPGRKRRDIALEDKLLAREVRRVIAKLPAGTRISVTELLVRAGGWAVFRHNRKAMPRTNQVVQDFRITNFSERQVGRRPYWRKRLGLEKKAN